jgi:hypothetical protein
MPAPYKTSAVARTGPGQPSGPYWPASLGRARRPDTNSCAWDGLHQFSTGRTPVLRTGGLSMEKRLDTQAVPHHREVIAMTAASRRQGSWRAMTAMRRAIGALRYVNDELTRANEAIFRPVGAARPRPHAGASTSATATAAATPEHTSQAA